MHFLCSRGARLLPVGLYEEKGGLRANFGELFTVRLPERASREEADGLVRQQIMVAIGRLLPRELWGFYAEGVASGLRPGQAL